MLFYDLRAESRSRDIGCCPDRMIRKSYRHAKPFFHIRNRAKMHGFIIGRIRAAALEEHNLPAARTLRGIHCLLNLFGCSHAARNNQRFSGRSRLFNKRNINQLKARDLVKLLSDPL